MKYYKKKYLFINPWDKVIGPNLYLFEFLKSLPDIAKDSLIIFHEENDAIKDYQKLGCQVIVSPFCSPLRFHLSFQNFFKTFINHTLGLVKFIHLLYRLKPSIVIPNTELLWISTIACNILKILHIQIFHGITFSYRLKHHPKVLYFIFYLYNLFNKKVIAVSKTVKNDIIFWGIDRNKVDYIPNPFSSEMIKQSTDVPVPDYILKKIDSHHPVIVSAGRICPIKGQELFVQALPEIFKIFPDAIVFFAGKTGSSEGIEDTDSYFNDLMKLIKQSKLQNKIIFLGEIDFLPAILKKCDIYVQPSRLESFGRVVSEALICGTPVAGFELEALKETAGPGAKLVPKYDTRALADAVIEILSDPVLRDDMVKKGREHVIKNYDTKIVAKRFLSILDSAKICAE